jgi:uncharacterized OsmC-like protein/esterase/lipase
MMKSKKINFTNADGQKLSATLDWPADEQPHNYAIFAHCFTCGKNLNAVRNISRTLAAKGFAVLSFDFTGLGQSEGEFAETNFSANISDLIAAANFLKEFYKAPSLLIGHSLGGAAVIKAAASIDSVKAIVTIGAPAEAIHVKNLLKDKEEEILKKGEAEVDLGGRPFTIKKQFIDDLEKQSVTQVLVDLRKSILILHSPQDKIVDIDNAAELYLAAHHPKSFVSLDGADHLLSEKADSVYVGDVIASWAGRYLNIASEVIVDTEHQTVAVVGDKASGYTTLVKAGKHFLTADEPEDVGGSDLGPSPYELLSSALATCTAMTLRMYANRKDLQIEQIKVHVDYSRKHCDDCGDAENPGARIDHFERLIEVSGELDEQQLKRLLEIADKCPVHKTLEGKIKIETKYK